MLRVVLAVAQATCRASHARQVKGDDTEKRDMLVLQVAGFDLRLLIPTHKKCSVEKLLKFEAGPQFWKRLRSTKDCNARRRRH
jgi:hypothetical protein